MITTSRAALECDQEGGRVSNHEKPGNRGIFSSLLLQEMSSKAGDQRNYVGVRVYMVVTNYLFSVA